MIRTLCSSALLVSLITISALAQSTPTGLRAVHQPDHTVALEWAEVPEVLPQYHEDFEDNLAQHWEYSNADRWEVTDGYLQVTKPAGVENWFETALYTGQIFDNYVLQVEVRVIEGAPNFCIVVNGEPHWFPSVDVATTTTYFGTQLVVDASGIESTNYRFLKYESTYGSGDAILPGNALNLYTVFLTDDAVSWIINGVDALTEAPLTIDTGWIGVGVWGNDAVTARIESVTLTPFGASGDVFDLYRVYRNGDLIAVVGEAGYVDTLPAPGNYEYRISAFFNTGESGVSDPDTVIWAHPNEYRLYETFNDIPPSGRMPGWTAQNEDGDELGYVRYWMPDLGRDDLLLSPNAMQCNVLSNIGWPDESERLVSPPFSLADVDNAVLRFDHAHNSYEPVYDEQCRVQASPNGFNWFDLTVFTGDADPNEVEVPLGTWVGEETVYLGFFYDHFGVNSRWEIDNVRVDVGDGAPYSFYLVPLGNQVPPGGGPVSFTANLIGILPQAYPTVNGWVSVQTPNGQTFTLQPVSTFSLPQEVNITVERMVNIPALAPHGTYQLTGHLGFFPVSVLSDSFPFTKVGATTTVGSVVSGTVGDAAQDVDPSAWKVHRR